MFFSTPFSQHHKCDLFFQSSEHFTDLSASYFELKLKLVKDDGTQDGVDVVHRTTQKDSSGVFTKGADYGVGPVSNVAHSLFSSSQLIANDQIICSESYYSYRSFFQPLFTYSKAVKDGWLKYLTGFRDDSPGLQDDVKNSALQWASDYQCRNSKVFKVLGHPNMDLFQSERLIPNLVSLKMTFTKNPAEFYIMSFVDDQKYKIRILDATFHLKRVVLNPTTHMTIERTLGQGTQIIYPVKSIVIKPFSIPQNNLNITIDTLFSSQMIPERLFLTFVESQSFTGKFTKSPFNLRHFKVSSVTISTLGRSQTQEYSWDALGENSNPIPYKQFIHYLGGTYPCDESFGVDREAYENGVFCSCFDLSASESYKTGSVSFGRQGNISLNVKFPSELAQPIILLAVGIYDNEIYCDVNRTFSKPFVY